MAREGEQKKEGQQQPKQRSCEAALTNMLCFMGIYKHGPHCVCEGAHENLYKAVGVECEGVGREGERAEVGLLFVCRDFKDFYCITLWKFF